MFYILLIKLKQCHFYNTTFLRLFIMSGCGILLNAFLHQFMQSWYTTFYILLNSICQFFIKEFYIYICERYQSVIVLFCGAVQAFLPQDNSCPIKWVQKYSLLLQVSYKKQCRIYVNPPFQQNSPLKPYELAYFFSRFIFSMLILLW